MRAPTAAELLGVWERSAAFGPAERADALLRLAVPDEDASDVPVGERDASLLDLRELLFGSELDGVADCAQCGEGVEYSLSADALRSGDGRADNGDLALSALGYELRLRPPTGRDLADAAAEGDLDRARARLLERCVLSASVDGREETSVTLPPALFGAVAERLAEAHPLADASFALTCPACGAAWSIAVDIAAWLWAEVESWARRTVLDVHTLASAYGWSEAEILALGPRRDLYLELVEG